MFSRLTRHMRHNVVAYLALFVALGGSSYAAIKLPANSVGAKQIKSNAVRSAEVKNSSLLARDFKRGQLPAGARGPQGTPGARGSSGATNVTVRSRYFDAGSNDSTRTVSCNPGEVATGGGVGLDIPSVMYVAQSEPAPNAGRPTGWKARINHRADGTPGSGAVYVLCATS